jgi:1-acyl-sn-glycerol-3-phosphate acyltransferase
MLLEAGRRVAPRSGLRHHVAGLVLKLTGWTPEGAPPDVPKFVIVAAPHTYWWDGVWMVAFAWWWELPLRWMVKSSLKGGVGGWLLNRLGAVPVERDARLGQVAALARAMRGQREIVLTIAPEGTRARSTHWKSGFYHLAREAEVPIVLSYLDYGTKKGGFGQAFTPSGDVKADMDIVRAFYRDVRAKYPEQFTPPKLREEDEPATVSAPEPAQAD